MPITNVYNLPKPFVDAATRNHEYTPKRYSVTSLLRGTKQTILERRHAHEIVEDVADNVWLIFGQAVHAILEGMQETDTQLKECWISADVSNGYTLSGIFDLYDDETGTVSDYKTATVWKIIYQDFDEWRMQILMYAWILRKMGFNARHGEAVALLKDHSKSKAKYDSQYPQHPAYKIEWDFSDDDFLVAESFIEAKFSAIEQAEALSDDDIPICTPEERWHEDDKWAVKKKGVKRAVRVYDNEAEAQERAERDGLIVEFRPGADKRCMEYCSAAPFCNHYIEILEGINE